MAQENEAADHASRIPVLIVDDHRMFAESLSVFLTAEPDIRVVGIASSGAEAADLVEQTRPAVVLVDYRLPDVDGVAITAEIKRRVPTAMVVMLTASVDDRVLVSAIEAGCSGFLTKDRAVKEVADAVRSAAAGEALVTQALLSRLLPRLSRGYRAVGSDLTERERDVLRDVAKGWSNKVIAADLGLSVNTVRNHVQSLLGKLGAHSKLEALSVAVREGIIDPPG